MSTTSSRGDIAGVGIKEWRAVLGLFPASAGGVARALDRG
jgi:hypothetical protein